jgi:hypothetical protein
MATMKNLYFLLIILILIGCAENPSTFDKKDSFFEAAVDITKEVKKHPDASFYWVNTDYLKQIKSGDDVCACMSENPFLLLYIGPSFENIVIQSSTFYFGLETTAHMKLNKLDNSNTQFSIDPIWPLQEEMQLAILKDTLTVTYDDEAYTFVSKRWKNIDGALSSTNTSIQSLDIFYHRNRLNASALLPYDKSASDTTLLSYAALKNHIDSGRASISCSDDYHFNSLFIEGDTNRSFHLEFEEDTVTLYEEPEGRGRFEKIDLKSLRKQSFFRN